MKLVIFLLYNNLCIYQVLCTLKKHNLDHTFIHMYHIYLHPFPGMDVYLNRNSLQAATGWKHTHINTLMGQHDCESSRENASHDDSNNEADADGIQYQNLAYKGPKTKWMFALQIILCYFQII